MLKHFPAVDILVNNWIYELSLSINFRRGLAHVFEVNVLSGVRLSRAYISG